MSQPSSCFEQCDFHTHTDLSGEAQARGFTLAELYRVADELGLRVVGYSEHWHVDTPPDLFRRIRDEAERLAPRHAVRVFVSAEIDALNSRGDLACDLVLAAGLLDYVSVAISHYGARGSEQLLPDRVDDTVRMIEAVCALPHVTMLMHPQIAYGRSLDHIAAPVGEDVYAHVLGCVAASGKVVDLPSLRMNRDWLATIYAPTKLAIAEESFQHFARQAVAQSVRLAPGSDAHHIWWHDGVTRWFGNNADSLELLRAAGWRASQLWCGPRTGA
ncbi:MAG: hypothetical protein V1772_12940 [Chloroflexota bacterium]